MPFLLPIQHWRLWYAVTVICIVGECLYRSHWIDQTVDVEAISSHLQWDKAAYFGCNWCRFCCISWCWWYPEDQPCRHAWCFSHHDAVGCFVTFIDILTLLNWVTVDTSILVTCHDAYCCFNAADKSCYYCCYYYYYFFQFFLIQLASFSKVSVRFPKYEPYRILRSSFVSLSKTEGETVNTSANYKENEKYWLAKTVN